MSRLSDAALQQRIAQLEATSRGRSLATAETDELAHLVHIQTCRVNARHRAIAHNQRRLAILTGTVAA